MSGYYFHEGCAVSHTHTRNCLSDFLTAISSMSNSTPLMKMNDFPLQYCRDYLKYPDPPLTPGTEGSCFLSAPRLAAPHLPLWCGYYPTFKTEAQPAEWGDRTRDLQRFNDPYQELLSTALCLKMSHSKSTWNLYLKVEQQRGVSIASTWKPWDTTSM